MASRAFSTSVRHLKKLKWTRQGTTQDVTWLTESMDDTVDHVPDSGNPHSTPSKNDPYHGSVELFNSAGQRITSAHVYPNGYVKFSKEAKYPPYKGTPHPKAPVLPISDPAGTAKSGN
ncbi:uncharacterized protein BO80DRAFT_455210 [Aspergillus ibericus CBS 121593]|uniref:Uncharacterized protein n=1 Tax=Aspergillus ibericus CBS 121593 TaxID=1448316 RepID=A0A395GZT6_9EURO|nr:hypothetical protein BO80DRAFT_455210 [Aspergillus ibericus CBS 121593]RAL01112.1 hypothetical protein BO80DRAFT_455210 [Aspergillus ibericus CBS 121593]